MKLFRLWLLLWGLGVVCALPGSLHAQGTQKLVRRNAKGQLIYSTATRNTTTYPRTKPGSKAFGKAVTTGVVPFTLTVASSTSTTTPVSVTSTAPVSVTNATPPSWLSARSTYSTGLALLDVEAAPVNSSDAIQLMFERQDGVSMSGSNPDNVPLVSGTFFGSGQLLNQGSYTQQWAFGQKNGNGGVPKVPLKLTFKRNSDTYTYLFTPSDATRAQLFTATSSSPPSSTTTSSPTITQRTYPAFTRAVLIGNSISTHTASTALNWNRSNGMAASAPEKDFAHLVLTELRKTNPNLSLAIMGQGSGLELGYNSSDKDAVTNTLNNLNFDLAQLNGANAPYDLIILRIGENAANNFDATKFRAMLDQSFAAINKASNCTILLTDSFWNGSEGANAVLKSYASEKGYKFATFDSFRERADLLATDKDANGNFIYSDAGVRRHPKDSGHTLIADAILAQLATGTTTVPAPTTTTPPAQTYVASAGSLPGPGTAPTYSDWNSRGTNYYAGQAFRTAPASVPANARSSFNYPIPSTLLAWPSDQNTKVLGDLRKAAVGPVIRLDGGSVSAEIRLRYGGGIAIYDKSTGYQGINWPDHGRQNAITWYSGPQNYSAKYGGQWGNIGYDPIGVGNVGEMGSPVQAMNYVTGNDNRQYLYIKTQLLNWPSGKDGFADELTGCWLEHWIRVDGDKVLVKARITHDNPDQTNYGGFNQEWPNFIMNSSTGQVAFSTATSTSGAVTFSNLIEQGQNDNAFQASKGVPRSFQQTPFYVSEPWQAINLHGKWWGITGQDYYRATNTAYKVWGGGNSTGEDTGDDEGNKPGTYLSAQVMLEAGPSVTYYTDYTFMVNADVNAIRSYANSLPQEALDYTFSSSRGNNMWYCVQGNQTGSGDDSGWPVSLGAFNQDAGGVTARNSSISSPARRWAASGISTIYVKMAYSGNRSTLNLNWLRNGQNPNNLDPDRPNESAARFPNGSSVGKNSVSFAVTGDGLMHTYAVPVGSSADWQGIIQQLYLNGFQTAGEPVRLKYIGTINPN